MNNRLAFTIWLTCAGLILLGGCVLPSPASTVEIPTTQPLPEQAYTEAVGTLIVELTRSASTPEPAALQSDTATPSPVPDLTTDTPLPALPTETPLPSQPSPTVTQTLLASDPKLSLGEPTWHDPFDTAENWYLLVDENSVMKVEEGQMVMTAFKANSLDWWALTWLRPTNYYLEAVGRFGACAELDRFGVIVRAPATATRGYLFGLSCDGKYSLWIMDTSIPRKTVLVDWTSSPNIQSGEGGVNRLGLMIQNDLFSLYANGNLLIEVKDSTLSDEYFGLFVGAASTPGFTSFVDEISYWELP